MHGSFKLCNSMILQNIVLTFLSWRVAALHMDVKPIICRFQHIVSDHSTPFLGEHTWNTSIPNTQQLDPRADCIFRQALQGVSVTSSRALLIPLLQTWRGFLRSVEISREHALNPHHTWTGYYSTTSVSRFPLLFMLISLIAPLSLNTFSSLLASGLMAVTQTLKDQIKIKKKKRAKYSCFRWRSRWGSWHFRGFKLTLCTTQGKTDCHCWQGSMQRPAFQSNIAAFQSFFLLIVQDKKKPYDLSSLSGNLQVWRWDQENPGCRHGTTPASTLAVWTHWPPSLGFAMWRW